MNKDLLLACVFLVACTSASAEKVKDCWNAGNTLQQQECIGEEIRIADKQLNTTYQRLIRLVRNHGEEWVHELRVAQKKWIEFRDLNCEFHSNYLRGGSGAGQIYGACKLSMTKVREKEFRDLADSLTSSGSVEIDVPKRPVK